MRGLHRSRRLAARVALIAALGLLPATGASAASWFDPVARSLNIGFDVLVVRPFALVTVAAGAVLLVPAVALSAPSGLDPIEEAWDRYIGAPGEQLWGRPLGEF